MSMGKLSTKFLLPPGSLLVSSKQHLWDCQLGCCIFSNSQLTFIAQVYPIPPWARGSLQHPHDMKFQSIITPFPKNHLVLFVLQLPSHSFSWHPWFLHWKCLNSHSAVTLSLAHNLIDIYCIPLCHLFFSLEKSYSVLSFLTGKLLHNSRSSPPLFPNLVVPYPLYAI